MDRPPEGKVVRCGLCDSGRLALILDLGPQPVAERYDTFRTYPLALLECVDCGLIQLSWIVPQHVLFPDGHPYTTGTSPSLVTHYRDLALGIAGTLKVSDKVVDIGANDGTLLSLYPPSVARIAVEPTDQAHKCRNRLYTTYQEFFTTSTARKILNAFGPVKAVTACNVLAHVPDPHDFLEGVRLLIGSDGVFVTENHDAEMVTKGGQFDAVYHEHLRYYTIATLSRLLAMHGLETVAAVHTKEHGGSFRLTARRRYTGDLDVHAASVAARLDEILRQAVAEGHQVYGVGATTRATPLMHFTGIKGYITCVCEVAGSEKIGRKMPGTIIPIVDEGELIKDQPAYAVIFAWHLADTIIPKLRKAGYEGDFIIPLPEPKIIKGGYVG